jgi:hypothetical protein
MAQKPDGKPAKSVAVTFTRPAAERIAHVVRTVERSGRDTKGPVWNPRMEGGGGGIRLCTFTGEWLIETYKIVKFASNTNATAFAQNRLFSIGDSCTAQRAYVSLVKDSETSDSYYHLINVQHFTAAIVTDVLLGTAAIEFKKKLAWLPYPGNTASQFINFATASSCS